MRISQTKESRLDVEKMLHHIQPLWKIDAKIFFDALVEKVLFFHIDNNVGSSE